MNFLTRAMRSRGFVGRGRGARGIFGEVEVKRVGIVLYIPNIVERFVGYIRE